MADSALRLLRILELVCHRKSAGEGITTSEIRKRLGEDHDIEVGNLRMIQRDLDTLCLTWPITRDESNKPHRWYWTGREPPTIDTMGPLTALTFRLAEQYLAPVMPVSRWGHLQYYFTVARRVLGEAGSTDARSWVDKIRVVPRRMALIPAPTPEPVLATITQAVYSSTAIDIRYRPARARAPNEATYRVHPYGLLHRDSITELVGAIPGEERIRRWLLHRIVEVTPTEEKVRSPAGFDLDDYINSPALAFPLSGQEIRLKAWFSNDIKGHVTETRLSKDQTFEVVEDGVIVSATVRESGELKAWLLGHGERVRVLEPEALVESIRATVQAMAGTYSASDRLGASDAPPLPLSFQVASTPGSDEPTREPGRLTKTTDPRVESLYI